MDIWWVIAFVMMVIDFRGYKNYGEVKEDPTNPFNTILKIGKKE